MSDEETAAVHAAIITLYGGVAPPEATQAASTWLTEYQKTVGVWTTCDRLLSEHRDPVSVCFSAQTLRHKIQKSLSEIPPTALISLRESIISHLSKLQTTRFDHLTDVTTTQLCLALADLYIQVHEWNDWLAELLNKFNSMDGDRTRILLVLLKVFPEEIDSSSVGESRRTRIREEIAASTNSVLLFLTQVLEKAVPAGDQDLIKKVIGTLGAYFTNPLVPTDEIAASPLLQYAFMSLGDLATSTSLVEVATTCVVNGLIRADDPRKHRQLAHALQKGCVGLRHPFAAAKKEEDLDRLQNIARIWVEMVESFSEFIINGASDTDEAGFASFVNLDILIDIADHHDYSLIEMTFPVWYRISEGLFQIDEDEYVFKFAPHVRKYLKALIGHVRYDTDMLGLPQSSCDLLDFRAKAAETIKDVVYIVSTTECVAMMFDAMKTSSTSGGTWDECEAALFVASHVVGNLLPNEASVMPELIGAIVGLPTASTHPALLLTAISFLGGSCEWLQGSPQYVEPTVAWLAELVLQPQFASAAGEAICSIACKCASAMAPSGTASKLLSLIPCLEAMTTNAKGVEGGVSYLLRAITLVTMNLPEAEMATILNGMGTAIKTQFELSLTASTMENNNGSNENERDAWRSISRQPVLWIDRISSVFREVPAWQAEKHGDRPAPWLQLAHELWVSISRAFQAFQDNSRVVEHICRAIRFLVRSLGVQSRGFVEPLVTQMMSVYGSYPHSCILYLASILVDEYGMLLDLQAGLLEMVKTLATRSFAELNKPNGLRDNPDTLDDLFRLGSRFVTRCPSSFFAHSMAAPLFDCAIAAITVDHQDANRSVNRFLCQSIDQLLSARRENYMDAGVSALATILREKGAAMTLATLRGGLFELNSHLRRDTAEILIQLKRVSPQDFSSWLQAAISTFSTTPPCASTDEMRKFHDNVMSEEDSRGIYGHMRDFTRQYS